jgi:hypothetical protein
MYIKPTRSYYAGTEQRAARGAFLLLLQLKDGPCNAETTFAIVRKVALHPLGNFMMGRANICGKWHTVSGAYGSDGLPMDVETLPKDAVRLPQDLYDAWNKGGGWNSAGSEAPSIRDWAIKQFKL